MDPTITLLLAFQIPPHCLPCCSHFCLLVRHRQFAIYLSVDSSVCSVRWTLAQDCSNGRRRPSRVLFWNFGGAHLYITFFFTRIRTLLLIFVVVSAEPQRRAYQQELQIIRCQVHGH